MGGEKKESDFTRELISGVKNSQGSHMIDTNTVLNHIILGRI